MYLPTLDPLSRPRIHQPWPVLASTPKDHPLAHVTLNFNVGAGREQFWPLKPLPPPALTYAFAGFPFSRTSAFRVECVQTTLVALVRPAFSFSVQTAISRSPEQQTDGPRESRHVASLVPEVAICADPRTTNRRLRGVCGSHVSGGELALGVLRRERLAL